MLRCQSYCTGIVKLKHQMKAAEVLLRYVNEGISDFLGIELKDVNQAGIDGDSPLHITCVRGIPKEVCALIAGGANIDACGEFRYSPLHHAVGHNHIGIVRMLLAEGADTKTRNHYRLTALESAKEDGYAEIVKLLESHDTSTL